MALDKDTTAQFEDSDDEDAPKKSSKKEPSDADPYKGSLAFKAGKGSNSSLYFVNYNVAKNGNGLDGEEKSKLASDFANAEAEMESLKHSIKSMTATTAKLLSEPTNEEADGRLAKEESELAVLKEQVEEARKLKVNEKLKKQTKKRIETMTSFWRKRRRICMDFLIAMEENTDGTVSMKKCLKGDGQIDIDSDEVVASGAIEYHKNKKSSGPGLLGKKRKFTKAKPTSAGLAPTEDFVAVILDNKGLVQRVHADDADQAMLK